MRADLKAAVKLVEDGLSYGDAAARHGLTRNAVAGACYRNGVKVGHAARMVLHAHKYRAIVLGIRADPKRDAKRLKAMREAMQRPSYRRAMSAAMKQSWRRRREENGRAA